MTGASDDGQAGVTEADRATAARIYRNWFGKPMEKPQGSIRDAIAVALAAERAKAREPFLALADRTDSAADELRGEGEQLTAAGWPASGQINVDAAAELHGWADRIRRAAEEQQ